jgi:hypothetical protein
MLNSDGGKLDMPWNAYEIHGCETKDF